MMLSEGQSQPGEKGHHSKGSADIDFCYFFRNRTSASFRRFCKSTSLRYRSCASRQVVLVVRFMLWKREGKTHKLGTFCPKVTAEQVKLYKTLYEQLLPGEGVDMADIATTAHRILYSTFTMHFSSRNKVDSAYEQSLIFSIMSPKPGHYLSANVLQQLFARTQRTCFSTFFHTAWLGGPEVDYISVDYTEDVVDEEEDEEGQEDEFESGLVDGEIEDVEDEMNELDFQGPGEGLGGLNEQDAAVIVDDTTMFELAGADGDDLHGNITTARPLDDNDDEGMFEVVPQGKEGDQILRCVSSSTPCIVSMLTLTPAFSWTIASGHNPKPTRFAL
jgi:hypothetical protein